MKELLNRPRFRNELLVVPQSTFLCDHNGEIGMDYIARYEDIQSSYEHIAERIGTPSKRLIEKNVSKHEGYENYYNDNELREMVRDFYSTDFDLLGYNKDLVLK